MRHVGLTLPNFLSKLGILPNLESGQSGAQGGISGSSRRLEIGQRARVSRLRTREKCDSSGVESGSRILLFGVCVCVFTSVRDVEAVFFLSCM